jgi:mRNA interferase HigB
VHIITRRRLNEFAQEHPDAQSALAHWYREVKRQKFANFVELRQSFPSADQVGNKTVFQYWRQ